MKQDKKQKTNNKTILKMKTKILSIILSVFGFALHASANEKIYVNREVTTHIVMPENIKLVDISTTKIIGNQCADNIVRIKPFIESDSIGTSGYQDDELLGTVTLWCSHRRPVQVCARHLLLQSFLFCCFPYLWQLFFAHPLPEKV